MDQHAEHLPPPPPLNAGTNAPGGHYYLQRQRVVPSSISTNLVRSLGATSQTPASANTFVAGSPYSSSPNTPSGLYPRGTPTGSRATSPRTATMEYDPRQWTGRGQVSGTQMVFQQRANVGTRDATGMEAAMPSPPPPYSPETPESARPSAAAIESMGFVASPQPAEGSNWHSPQAPMSPAFPPPPGQSSRHRERSGSGMANRTGFFSLAGLRGKNPSNTDLHASQSVHVPEVVDPRPPAARRAASTGHMQTYGVRSGANTPAPAADPNGRDSPSNHWQPGMPLPGPPPGPPPPGARSQSLNRHAASSSRSSSIGSEHGLEAPRPRRAAAASSSLGPVPPTPADWVDTDAIQQAQDEPVPDVPAMRPEHAHQPLRIETGMNDVSLTRRPAKRDSSSQGIRERRSQSRAARDGSDIMSPESEAKPSDLIFTTAAGSISRRREHGRTASTYVEPSAASNSKAPVQAKPPSQMTPNNVLTPPYTPAVGKPNTESLRKQQPLRVPGSASSDRPISHLLHQPVEDAGMVAPMTPSRPPSSASGKLTAKLDAFALQALERHRVFAEKEATATSDEERLELFANFIVHESRLRRDRYSSAYNAMAGDIVDLTRDMWRSYTGTSKRAVTPSTSMSSFDPTMPSWASDGQPNSAFGNVPSSASSMGDFTPGTDGKSEGEGVEPDARQWGEVFKPSLSPIPSMNVSTVNEEDSRGRAPSRWWEASHSGSGSVGHPDRIQKSRRETKYMGVDPASLQENDRPSTRISWHTGSTPGPSTGVYGPDEYPPEKVGWHENGDTDTPMPTPSHPRKVSTPGINTLDVSRLVTLPPPYPRHHPAVNNKHPLLADVRSEYRELAEPTDIQEIKNAYLDKDFALQKQQGESAKERKKHLRSDIQEKIADGAMSFADAAQAEADFDVEEAERGKATARSNFDVFEASVAHPLNNLLTERLQKANACINQLRAELESRDEASDPNSTQEEGDEQPERLEKLTLLKWLFEAREQLHKEMCDLHADRSAKYSEVILTPYRISKQQAKIDEANKFFKKDDLDRQISFAKDSLKRYEELQRIMDGNVSRGVEDQLSAFWDIAPSLLEVVHYLPANMSELDIQIPEQEYEENPAYHRHPLQYLYSLLGHAEKSAYQFIESQTNLLCLLHEVRTATMKSSSRVLEIEQTIANPDDGDLQAEMEHARVAQEERLTEDLQEKVGEVERQWKEALGEGLEECKERVKVFLDESGGWEDGLDG